MRFPMIAIFTLLLYVPVRGAPPPPKTALELILDGNSNGFTEEEISTAIEHVCTEENFQDDETCKTELRTNYDNHWIDTGLPTARSTCNGLTSWEMDFCLEGVLVMFLRQFSFQHLAKEAPHSPPSFPLPVLLTRSSSLRDALTPGPSSPKAPDSPPDSPPSFPLSTLLTSLRPNQGSSSLEGALGPVPSSEKAPHSGPSIPLSALLKGRSPQRGSSNSLEGALGPGSSFPPAAPYPGHRGSSPFQDALGSDPSSHQRPPQPGPSSHQAAPYPDPSSHQHVPYPGSSSHQVSDPSGLTEESIKRMRICTGRYRSIDTIDVCGEGMRLNLVDWSSERLPSARQECHGSPEMNSCLEGKLVLYLEKFNVSSFVTHALLKKLSSSRKMRR